METLFSPETRWLWSAALGLALSFPVRQLIWALSVRREQRRSGEFPDEAARHAMKRLAGSTSSLLCVVFAEAWGGVLLWGGTK